MPKPLPRLLPKPMPRLLLRSKLKKLKQRLLLRSKPRRPRLRLLPTPRQRRPPSQFQLPLSQQMLLLNKPQSNRLFQLRPNQLPQRLKRPMRTKVLQPKKLGSLKCQSMLLTKSTVILTTPTLFKSKARRARSQRLKSAPSQHQRSEENRDNINNI